MRSFFAAVILGVALASGAAAEREVGTRADEVTDAVRLAEAPKNIPCFDAAEFVVQVADPSSNNPFTDVDFSGEFSLPSGAPITVLGFADAQDGTVFRLRFCPEQPGATYRYTLRFQGAGLQRQFQGELACVASERPGPVVVDPQHPRHFRYLGAKKPFYHVGYTAYHVLDPSNSLADIDGLIDYCARHGFNKIRFLLSGYPRDFDRRSSTDAEYGVPDPWKAPNYGARPGQVNPLPAWLGKPHAYDFTRMNVGHWQRADYAVRRMRERNIVATCIVTIEKQNLPKEYGTLTEHEYRLYRYAVARLAAFDNVWWDLGNEHNEFRDKAWGDTMGAFVKETDPFARLASAHGHQEVWYAESPWYEYIITQQYGDERAVHQWALEFRDVPKPFVNEEYGYEGALGEPGHAQNADWTRRCHWSIAMAGGYATYGDWTGGVAWFYMGQPGHGQTPEQLKHLRALFEQLPFPEMAPHDEWTGAGFCLAKPSECYLFYFPRGGNADIRIEQVEKEKALSARWYDPRSGQWRPGPAVQPGANSVVAPDQRDWVLLVDE
ncbi:MAG: apiosidase-like domain-containing protein [Thermoguttaceae bacterium]